MKIAIEHLEEEYSLWIIYEYINASILCEGKIIYTNIDRERVARILSRYGEVYREKVDEIINPDNLIILDPEASKPLSPYEINRETVLVVGGILGDNPPRKRTKKLLTDRIETKARNLGEKQMSIDGAAYTAYLVANGMSLNQIPFIDGLEIVGRDWEVTLPYRYPLKNSRPILSPIIKRIIEEIGIFDEYWMRTF